jgi:hypothetical protein
VSAAAVVGNLGVVYRLLKAELGEWPADGLTVTVHDREVALLVHPGGVGDDVAAVERVWALAELLDERELVRASVTAARVCFYTVHGRLAGFPVEVGTVLSAASPRAAGSSAA